MSSSIADLGAASGAAKPARPLPPRSGVTVEDVDDPTMSLASSALPAPADNDALVTSNVIELEAPQLGRANAFRRAPPPPRARVDPRGVALAVRFSDAVCVALAGAATYWLQPNVHWPLNPTAAFSALAIMAMLGRAPKADSRYLHDYLRRPLPRRLAHGACRTLLPFVCSFLVLAALIPLNDVLRAPLAHWLALWAMGAVASVAAIRLALSGLIAYWRRHGHLKQSVAIYGTGELAERLLDRLHDSALDTIELVGVFDDRARRRIASPGLRSLALGTTDDLIALSRRRDIDQVIVALPHAAEHRVVEILKKLRHMPVEISLAPDMVGFNLPHREPNDLGGLPLLGVYGQPLTFGQVLIKGVVDKLLAGLALVVGAPVLLALALAIKIDTRGPVFFRQNRHGFGDRVIRVFKFRTMTHETADLDGTTQSRPNDPRVTRIGHFLRRWSLDELPQLLNVLRGDMSLVGPRPHAICMVVEERPNRDIVPDYAMRHHVKPGITGWAQINGFHGPVATEDALRARVRFDLDYINNWSLWFDLRIILGTLKIVLGQRHAY
ncbi:MAG TPA: undecaprenyl-phosphate glucose phosphotransferase [Stellaceae bacterium]|jgi:Undecaprenyl-phosphate glucose phosphotransferase|nr:undecaprenyl-phosphate glucose phosphotransferase [Stellaceae bacterium]